MDKSSNTLLEQFYHRGGKLLFTEGLPTFLEGKEFHYCYDTNTTLEQIADDQEFRINKENQTVYSTYRLLGEKKFLFIVNTDDKNSADVQYSGKFNSFVQLDLETLETKKQETSIHLEPSESRVLFQSDEEVVNHPIELKELLIDGYFDVLDKTENYLTLDKAFYSKDGINYSTKYHVMGIFNELLNERYDGDIYLKYVFEVEALPESIQFYCEKTNVLEVFVNKEKKKFSLVSEIEHNIIGLDISNFVSKGINEVIIKIRFYQKPQIYYALFTEGVTESLRNCIAYDTTIEASYLKGDFGVYSKSGMKVGNETNTYLSEDDFIIGMAKSTISNTITEGYPFFSGNMIIKKELDLDDCNYYLNLCGRYHLIYIKINGIDVKKSYFGKEKIDISKYLKKGKNEFIFNIFSSNRNLLGPHHFINEEEPFGVRPAIFEAFGTWNKGKSTLYRDNYSFVRFGLFKNK